MGKILSHLKVSLMNLITIKLPVENTRPRLVYAERRATRKQILKRFNPDLIKADLWFHILKFFSQRNLQNQVTFVKA